MNGLSKYYIKKLITCFAEELTATETSKKLKVNRNTVNKYYRIVREAIADYQTLQANMQVNAHGKQITPFYWHKSTGISLLHQPDSAVYYIAIINRQVFVENAADNNNDTHADSPATTATQSKSNDLSQSFFLYAKDKLTKFYGVKEQYTSLYLKELEFRFNNREKDIIKLILKILPHHSAEWVKTNKYRK